MRTAILAVLGVLLATLLVGGFVVMLARPNSESTPVESARTISALPEANDELIETDFTVLSYHITNCGSCHGNFGEQHIKSQLAAMNDITLLRVVREMTEGQGQAPLSDAAELGALVAFHRSVQNDRPFLTISSATNGLNGEITPGFSLTLINALGQESAAVVTGNQWSSTSPDAVRFVASSRQGTTIIFKRP